MFECVINISEGRRLDVIAELQRASGTSLIDTHSDAVHHRTVLTLAGERVLNDALGLAAAAASLLDLSDHLGVHPRLGVIDVVPFVPFSVDGHITSEEWETARSMRNAFGEHLATELQIPCFFYGEERSLPQIRRCAFTSLFPDVGPPQPNRRSGACCVGVRKPLIAYNVWLKDASMHEARQIARDLRAPLVRTLAFDLGRLRQVSFNLIDPDAIGPMQVFDLVGERATIDHAELVGLLPLSVLRVVPTRRWRQLDIAEERTIEYRINSNC